MKKVTMKMWELVDEYRNRNVIITNETADEIYRYCNRKMEIAKIKNPAEYINVLYPNELKDYLTRRAVNAKTILGSVEKEEIIYV